MNVLPARGLLTSPPHGYNCMFDTDESKDKSTRARHGGWSCIAKFTVDRSVRPSRLCCSVSIGLRQEFLFSGVSVTAAVSSAISTMSICCQEKPLESLEITNVPMVCKAQILSLTKGDSWIDQGVNVQMSCPPGVGKQSSCKCPQACSGGEGMARRDRTCHGSGAEAATR